MTLRAPIGPKSGPWRRSARDVRTDTVFIERVLALWDAGKDTEDISKMTFEEENVVAIALRVGREKRREENWK